MIVIPAIDLRGGRAVRLRRGDPSEETSYANDPVEVAERFQEQGARRLHVIDLDAALGEGDNREAIGAICRAVVVPVQVGGGIRSLEAVAAMFEVGAARAILGTAAAADVSFVGRAVEEFAERVVVAVDVRGGRLMIDGWREEGPELDEALAGLNDAGAPRYLVTAIARDWTLEGPDLTLYKHVLKLTDRPVIASGGVRNADDVWALRDVSEKLAHGQGLLGSLLTSDGDGGLGPAAADFKVAMANLRAVTERLKDGQGTVGALLEDPTVYENLVQVLDGAKRSYLLRALIRSSIGAGAGTGAQAK